MATSRDAWDTSVEPAVKTHPLPRCSRRHARERRPRKRRGSDPYDVVMDYERITIDPGKMRGVPCIRGLRIPVATVIGQLAAGRTADEILAEFPDLEADDIPAALEYAAAAVQERELPLTRPA